MFSELKQCNESSYIKLAELNEPKIFATTLESQQFVQKVKTGWRGKKPSYLTYLKVLQPGINSLWPKLSFVCHHILRPEGSPAGDIVRVLLAPAVPFGLTYRGRVLLSVNLQQHMSKAAGKDKSKLFHSGLFSDLTFQNADQISVSERTKIHFPSSHQGSVEGGTRTQSELCSQSRNQIFDPGWDKSSRLL